MLKIKSICIISALLLILVSCNKDDIIFDETLAPKIEFSENEGVYQVKIGRNIEIEPQISNSEDAIITWSVNNHIICRGEIFNYIFQETGEYFVTVAAHNEYGSSYEEIRIDVVEKTPPVIDLKVPNGGFFALVNSDLELKPEYQFDDLGEFSIEWILNNEVVSTEKEYTFCQNITGKFNLTINASNEDGVTSRDIEINIVETMPYKIEFPKPYLYAENNNRYTFANRPVYLKPNLFYFTAPVCSWTVNGKSANCDSDSFVFMPDASGVYNVTLTVTEETSGYQASETVIVECVSATEMSRMRVGNSNNHVEQNKVFEYLPAPGQFIGELSFAGGFTGTETTMEAAINWATERLNKKSYVSLGSWGGYIIVGFDHSIPCGKNEYDFAIQGNAFDSSNEPGVVWVMQDVNGNGLPDDEWYELRGSETGKETTTQDYWVTYYKPSAPRRDVRWIDSKGQTGSVVYNSYHTQDYYYPTWMQQESYTLYGTCLASRNTQDSSTGYWSNNPYDWGYVDNKGADNLAGSDSYTGLGQRNGFKISNAMYADQTPIKLKYIDFIKVQCGVNTSSGVLGEVSTEVFSFEDLSLTK